MVVRYAVSGVLAFLVTSGLFFMMQSLISMDGVDGKTFKRGGAIEFVRLRLESATEARKRVLPKRPEQHAPPAKSAGLDLPKAPRPRSTGVSVAIPAIHTNVDIAGGLHLGTAPADSDATPILQVSPIYPSRAAQRGIEGWVLVEFTITPTGAVADPLVIDSYPSSIFNRSALRAIKRWKYRPKVVDGVAVERKGIRTEIEFELEGS